MSSSEQRPRQATIAGWMIVLGSVFAVVSAFEVVSGLRSIETREAVTQFLSEPPGSGLGLDVQGALDVMRVAASVSAVCATMAAILGVFVLRRDRRARIGLAVLAVPLFVSGFALGGFMTSLVAAASAVLWLSPSREWFAGKPLPEPARRPGARSADDDRRETPAWPERERTPVPDQPEHQEHRDQPAPAATPYAAAPAPTSHARTAAADQPADDQPSGGASARQRPDAVAVAVVLTFIVSGLVLMSAVLGVVVMAASPDLVFEELERQRPGLLGQEGMTEGVVRTTTIVTGVLCILASLAAIGLAIGTLMRRAWAARALFVLSLATAGLSLFASIGSLVAVVPAVAAVVTAVCLRRTEVRAWLSG